ncbi:MAG: squalene--hopene cyclase, partial [Burkholderiales bacterium]|nr:squalene--hopene cyclase [Burkholderiales bacterium]
DRLLLDQHADGFWCYEFEADCTIPAEYILMMHFMDEIDEALEAKIAVYLREHQQPQGGWGLYPGSDFDISCSVKAYYALKLAGDDPQAPHMARARQAILAHGGAARA